MQKSIIFLSSVLLMSFGSSVFADPLLLAAAANISFPGADNTILRGYLALPAGKGPFPAVLMIHEWWGLNQNIKLLADALAAQGYVVLAADAFRGRVAQTAGEAQKQVADTPPAQIAADLDAFLKYLRSRPDVDPQKVASLGFCFGGTQSMYLGTRRPELAAVIIFYGSGPITDVKDLGSMKEAGPVLGIYGENDGNIPVDKVKAFGQALKAKGVKNTITIYPGVGHAFVKADNYNKGGTPEKAWKQMIQFLKDTFPKPRISGSSGY
jgi:carboxymethylenebutenolidase